MASEKQEWLRVISAVLDDTQKGPDGRLVQEQGAEFRRLEIGCGLTGEIEVCTEIYFRSQQVDDCIFFRLQVETSLEIFPLVFMCVECGPIGASYENIYVIC